MAGGEADASAGVASPAMTGTRDLIEKMDAVVRLREVHAVTEGLKHELSELFLSGAYALDDRFRHSRPDGYARRLIHRSPALGYTAVMMSWGPGQGTLLHDHAGLWCVEGVVEGEMTVTQYDLLEEAEDRYRFAERGRIHASVGSAGALIPPTEYHVLANASPDRTSVTLHIYGGEMDRCAVFEPRPDGWHDRRLRALAYDEVVTAPIATA